MVQPITDYSAFFSDAKEAVRELEQLKMREEQLLNLENELENSLKIKQKQISDTISQTVKKREEEITKSYDVEIGKKQERLKKVRGKREKAKNQGVKERIAEDTQNLKKENADLKRQLKVLFHTNHVPKFCAGKFYYALYFTNGIKEIMTFLITLFICFFVVPCGIYFLLPERKTLYLAIVYVLTILVFGGSYVKIGNATKLKHMDILREGRKIHNMIRGNKKQIKKITKEIRKDKDDAAYDLEKYDDEITQLEQDMAQAEKQKKEALSTFATVTKIIIADEIKENSRAELTQMESDLGKTNEDLKETQQLATNKALYLTNHFEVYVGKEFMTMKKLGALEGLIQSQKASNLSEAIKMLKEAEHV